MVDCSVKASVAIAGKFDKVQRRSDPANSKWRRREQLSYWRCERSDQN